MLGGRLVVLLCSHGGLVSNDETGQCRGVERRGFGALVGSDLKSSNRRSIDPGARKCEEHA
jgi:hypothetical protein